MVAVTLVVLEAAYAAATESFVQAGGRWLLEAAYAAANLRWSQVDMQHSLEAAYAAANGMS